MASRCSGQRKYCKYCSSGQSLGPTNYLTALQGTEDPPIKLSATIKAITYVPQVPQLNQQITDRFTLCHGFGEVTM